MTADATGTPRPADAAREALRAARERAAAEQDSPAQTGGSEHGAARPEAEGQQEQEQEQEEVRGRRSGPAGTTEQGSVDAGRPRPTAAGVSASGVRGNGRRSQHADRPADVAREALRAARRDALRGDAARAPGARRGPRTPAPPAGSPSPRPLEEHRPDRAQAVRDMRHFLSNAFRMPAWAEEGELPEDRSATGHPPAQGQEPTAGVPGPTEPHPGDTGGHPGDSSGALSRTEPAPDPVDAGSGGAAHTEMPGPAEPYPAAPGPGHDRTRRPAPASPRLPLSMAAPHRDTDLRRTFPAFAAREGGAEFAESWWGNAWVDALEQGALDVKRLARGRGYAEQGHVDAITVTPGLVLAYVRGSRPRPYRVQVRLRTLEDDDWDRFLDAAADRPGHIAALLDKELPHSLADCGVPLLPGPGDLAPRCSCPDSGHPCKHAAALCYQTARLLDADPFVLLLLRGRGERELLDALSRRSAARAARAAQEREPRTLPGVRAAEALAPRRLPPLPPPLPLPPHPEQPPVYPGAPGGPDPFALDQLATDAAARAHTLLGTGHDSVGELTLWQDAVRLAAARPGSGLTAATRALYATLAAATGRTPADLARAVAAWRQGGLDGLAVLEEPWDPPAGRFDRARPLLLAADFPVFRPWRNRLTHPGGRLQLRLGQDALWYAYESEPGQDDWWPRGTPDPDPVGALTGLGGPADL
ncbi:SWIM zinc finger family protein [Streptomyces sp. L2]|uniref:SWIM zinc finger family protein n=1 Tax=Streptomyces sp. L2 TaxID=2162665 RepID=UPI00101394EF|nr:SWIM zinc finger family protein [Streptomyces sp. L2]